MEIGFARTLVTAANKLVTMIMVETRVEFRMTYGMV